MILNAENFMNFEFWIQYVFKVNSSIWLTITEMFE